MQLQNLVDQPNKLPTIPKVVAELINSFNAEDVALPAIAKLLASDAALSAKLLRLANSAYFHVSRTVGTVDEALRMLGFVMVRNLVLGNGMVAAFRNTKGMQLSQFWRYNLYTACAARWLAHHNGDNGDKAFTLGMMHSIGQLQLHAVAAAEVQPLDAQMNVLDAGRADLELQAFGFHYGDVSAALGEIWNFPSLLTNTLREIPSPLKATTFNRDAGWIHLAAWRARIEVLEFEEEAIIASYPAAVAKRLNLSPDWVPLLNTSATNSIFSSKVADAAMPPFAELAAGLDAMLE
jgi:HD-like signal output (HDOD) protein